MKMIGNITISTLELDKDIQDMLTGTATLIYPTPLTIFTLSEF